MPLAICPDSHLRQVVLGDDCRVQIVENEALEQLLFNRNLVGLSFRDTCTRIMACFLAHAAPEIQVAGEDVAELVILTKGIYYNVATAFGRVFARNLDANFIATKRHVIDDDHMTIEVTYRDFSAPASTIIVADTVASGKTICRALTDYHDNAPLRQALVFSAAGSVPGALNIFHHCNALGVRCTLFYGLAAFGLAENGFDLSFLNPATICPNDAYVARARILYDNKPVSAVGWDFGSQAQSVRKYKALCWLEARRWGFGGHEVFALQEEPRDWRLVEKERAAFEKWVECPRK